MMILETKTSNLKGIILFVLAAAIILPPLISIGQDYSSSSYTVKDPVLTEGTQSSSSASFGLGQSIGQTAIGRSVSASFQVWSGFQYYFHANPNVLTATPSEGQVQLNWTVPETFLGITVSGYELGTGTISGSYVFEDVGNVIAYNKSGLTNGTPYFFIVKAKAAGGLFLVYSNESTATPTGAVTPPPGGGGGGVIPISSSIVFSGISYPNSTITVIRDAAIAGSFNADNQGHFEAVIENLPAGSYSFSLYATDNTGVKSANLSFAPTLTAGTTYFVRDLLIPPTISTEHSEIKQGENLVIRGFSQPNSLVTLNLSGPSSRIFTSSANPAGFYQFAVNTNTLDKGDYETFSFSALNGRQSQPSLKVGFKIGDKTVAPPKDECKRSDLNCDGRVNLIDFSILLYFWDKPPNEPNPRADIDKSGWVGIKDLSIMLYDWTG
jgi:hypothetical protein